jgi:hypothetical protein
MATFADLIDESFIDLAVISPGMTITSTMQTKAFRLLQTMWSNWANERLMSYLPVHQNFSLIPGFTSYTLGPSGTFATTGGLRAVMVTGWSAYYLNFRSGGRIMSLEEFHAENKDLLGSSTTLPTMVGADQGNPYITVEVFPSPASVAATLRLDYFTPLVQFSAVSDTISLPDGYEEAIRTGLAVRLYPQYQRPGVSLEVLAAAASNAKETIAQRNAAILGMVKAA